MARGFIDDEQKGFRPGKGCVDQIFTLKQVGRKAWEKNYVGFVDLDLIGNLSGMC